MRLKILQNVVAALATSVLGCGPSTSEGGGSETGAATDVTDPTDPTETGSTTEPAWSIEDLRPWFGEYHVEGELNPPLDVRFELWSFLHYIQLREDGTFTQQLWDCGADAPSDTEVFTWTQLGPTTIQIDGWTGTTNLSVTGPVIELVLRDGCPVLQPEAFSNATIVGGRACWVTRDCGPGGMVQDVVEITLCDGTPTACQPS